MATNTMEMTDQTRAELRPEIVDFLERQNIKLPNFIVGSQDGIEVLEKPMDQANIDDPKLRGIISEAIFDLQNSEIGAYSIDLNSLAKEYADQDLSERADPNDIIVVTAPTLTSASELVYEISGTPERNVNPTLNTINNDDLKAYMLFHEMGHASHGEITHKAEYEGDEFANDLYQKAYQEGLVTDPRIPEMMGHMRALASFNQSETAEFYPLNGMIDVDNPDANVTPNLKTENDLFHVVSDAYYDVGKENAGVGHEFRALGNLSAGTRMAFMDVRQQMEFIRLQKMESDPAGDRIETLDQMEKFMAGVEVSEMHAEEFNQELYLQIRSEGEEIVHGEMPGEGQPELLYNTVRDNLIAGQYKDDPAAQQLAENFVLGAERLAPDNYNVSDNAQTYEQYLKTQGTPDTFGYDFPAGQTPQSETPADPKLSVPTS